MLLILAPIAIFLLLVGWAVIARQLAPLTNTSLTRFDTLIVLGSGVDRTGNPTPDQLARVLEAVHEYERGVAPRMIMTGMLDNGYSQARIMARTAEAQGIPAAAIIEEPDAWDTIHNACYAARIMRAHGWHSAEVISRASHLPRAALIFGGVEMEWRMHAAPPLEVESTIQSGTQEVLETFKTLRYLAWARQTERCEP